MSDPIRRINTGDNTPAIIHYEIINGDSLTHTCRTKGFWKRKHERTKMLKPSDGIEGVKKTVIDAVSQAGANPCPPVIVGVGIGGTMEKAAIMSKKALLRPIDRSNPDPYYKALEQELFREHKQAWNRSGRARRVYNGFGS